MRAKLTIINNFIIIDNLTIFIIKIYREYIIGRAL